MGSPLGVDSHLERRKTENVSVNSAGCVPIYFMK